MNDTLIRSWWVFALRGVIAIAFAVLALIWPGITLLTLVALFAAYALLGGIVAVIGAFRNRRADEDWWLPLLLGLVGIAAGIIAVIHPALTALVLVLVMGANAMVTGILEIVTAIRLRKTISNEWLMALSGIASLIFGIIVFLYPGAGALAMIWLISLYAFITGVLLLTLSFRLRARATGRIAAPERRITPDRRATPAHP